MIIAFLLFACAPLTSGTNQLRAQNGDYVAIQKKNPCGIGLPKCMPPHPICCHGLRPAYQSNEYQKYIGHCVKKVLKRICFTEAEDAVDTGPITDDFVAPDNQHPDNQHPDGETKESTHSKTNDEKQKSHSEKTESIPEWIEHEHDWDGLTLYRALGKKNYSPEKVVKSGGITPKKKCDARSSPVIELIKDIKGNYSGKKKSEFRQALPSTAQTHVSHNPFPFVSCATTTECAGYSQRDYIYKIELPHSMTFTLIKKTEQKKLQAPRYNGGNKVFLVADESGVELFIENGGKGMISKKTGDYEDHAYGSEESKVNEGGSGESKVNEDGSGESKESKVNEVQSHSHFENEEEDIAMGTPMIAMILPLKADELNPGIWWREVTLVMPLVPLSWIVGYKTKRIEPNPDKGIKGMTQEVWDDLIWNPMVDPMVRLIVRESPDDIGDLTRVGDTNTGISSLEDGAKDVDVAEDEDEEVASP